MKTNLKKKSYKDRSIVFYIYRFISNKLYKLQKSHSFELFSKNNIYMFDKCRGLYLLSNKYLW